MAKNKDEGELLVKIAGEMNTVMAYGKDSKTGEVDESELIDTDLSDKALKAEILKRAEDDLRASDEPDFSPEAWQFFIDNGIIPAGSEGNGGGDEDGGDEDAPADDSGDDDEEAPAKGKGGKGKPDKKADAEKGEKKKGNVPSRAMIEGGNEAYAKKLVKEKVSYDDFVDAFRKLYVQAGKKDEKYIQSRARIYWNIAHKQLGITPKDGPKKAEPAAKSDKKAEKADKGNAKEKGDKKAEKGGKSKK